MIVCDSTERWSPGRAGGGQTQQPVSISPLTGSSGSSWFSDIPAYLIINLSSLPPFDTAAAAKGGLRDGFFAPKRRALTATLKLQTTVYAAVSIPFKGFTRHQGLRDLARSSHLCRGWETAALQKHVERRRGLRHKRCTCPSCSPPTWPSVECLLRQSMKHSLASKVPPLLFSPLLIISLQPTARTTD